VNWTRSRAVALGLAAAGIALTLTVFAIFHLGLGLPWTEALIVGSVAGSYGVIAGALRMAAPRERRRDRG
jgi:hypothetical protein